MVAGRPVLTHPLRAGGFRLRYGRCRTSGYSASAIHPATMVILNKYIAIGTQLKVERPGKATAVSVCDFIEGPIVKLNDNSVVRVDSEQKAKQVSNSIKEILFLGDILISYGDFFNRAHTLVPAGYCEEWWAPEVEQEMLKKSLDFEKLSELVGTNPHHIKKLLVDYFEEVPDAKTSIKLSKALGTPLHPRYTYHWKTIQKEEFLELLRWLESAKIEVNDGKVDKIVLPKHEIGKRVLELIGVPHIFVNNEFTIIEKNDAEILHNLLNMSDTDFYVKFKNSEKEDVLDLINSVSEIKVKDKSGTFIGARMGRPEKAKIRKLDGDPHTLFPVGKQGGKTRSFQSTFEVGSIEAEYPLYFCSNCKKETILSSCEQCDTKTQKMNYCNLCGLTPSSKCVHGETFQYKSQKIDINYYFKSILKKLNMGQYPDLIKGVRGTSSKHHIPEHFAKGILRAKYEMYVNRDGTTRYDMTQLPITHFMQLSLKS